MVEYDPSSGRYKVPGDILFDSFEDAQAFEQQKVVSKHGLRSPVSGRLTKQPNLVPHNITDKTINQETTSPAPAPKQGIATEICQTLAEVAVDVAVELLSDPEVRHNLGILLKVFWDGKVKPTMGTIKDRITQIRSGRLHAEDVIEAHKASQDVITVKPIPLGGESLSESEAAKLVAESNLIQARIAPDVARLLDIWQRLSNAQIHPNQPAQLPMKELNALPPVERERANLLIQSAEDGTLPDFNTVIDGIIAKQTDMSATEVKEKKHEYDDPAE